MVLLIIAIQGSCVRHTYKMLYCSFFDEILNVSNSRDSENKYGQIIERQLIQ